MFKKQAKSLIEAVLADEFPQYKNLKISIEVVISKEAYAKILEYADKIKVCKLDIHSNQATPPKYGIRGIPTLMLFKNGEVEATKVGALSKSQLQAFLDSNI